MPLPIPKEFYICLLIGFTNPKNAMRALYMYRVKSRIFGRPLRIFMKKKRNKKNKWIKIRLKFGEEEFTRHSRWGHKKERMGSLMSLHCTYCTCTYCTPVITCIFILYKLWVNAFLINNLYWDRTEHTRLLKQWIKKHKIIDCSLIDMTYGVKTQIRTIKML